MWTILSELLIVLFDTRISILSREKVNMTRFFQFCREALCKLCNLSGIFTGKGASFGINRFIKWRWKMTDYAIDRLVASVKHATVNIIKYFSMGLYHVLLCIDFLFWNGEELVWFRATLANFLGLELHSDTTEMRLTHCWCTGECLFLNTQVSPYVELKSYVKTTTLHLLDTSWSRRPLPQPLLAD